MKILITGISGTGKTTILSELQKHGYVCIDLDATGLCHWRHKGTGEPVKYGLDGRDTEWLRQHGWYCDISKLHQLLSCIREYKTIFIAGISENLQELADEFDKTIKLSASQDIIRHRLDTRTNNHFGRTDKEKEFIFSEVNALLDTVNYDVIMDSSKEIELVAEEIISNFS